MAMAETLKREEIEELIKKGFDLKLISLEFDIPLEELEKIKAYLDAYKTKRRATSKESSKKDEKEDNIYDRIIQLRDRYNKLYNRMPNAEVPKMKSLSNEDLVSINLILQRIEDLLTKMQDMSKRDKRNLVYEEILNPLQRITKTQLPLPQAEKCYVLLCSDLLNDLKSSEKDLINYVVRKQRKILLNHFLKAIEYEQYNVHDREGLEKLSRKITPSIIQASPILGDAAKKKILQKINNIDQKEAIDRIRNNIPKDIKSIIIDLANGTIDVAKANVIIDKEAKNRVESKKGTKFRLTHEQERRQILMQIRAALSNNTDEFQIKNPEATILKLQELCNMELIDAIRVILKNLISRKSFVTAKGIIDEFANRTKGESLTRKDIKSFKNEIRNAEISDMVMKIINSPEITNKEIEYFRIIENGINLGNVNLAAIHLGESKDDVHRITLEDIWSDGVGHKR